MGDPVFPKDVNALIVQAKSRGMNPRILTSVIATNNEQPGRMIALLKQHLNPKGHTVGVLGLALSPILMISGKAEHCLLSILLLKEGARVKAYDPMAMTNFKKICPRSHV